MIFMPTHALVRPGGRTCLTGFGALSGLEDWQTAVANAGALGSTPTLAWRCTS
jgi:hypothetical protein